MERAERGGKPGHVERAEEEKREEEEETEARGFLLWMPHETVARPRESTTERREKGVGGRRITAGDNKPLLLMFDGSQPG